MEIYLRVENEDVHLADLEVRVERSHTVRDVADAVVGYLGVDPRTGRTLSRASTGPIDDTLPVSEAGLLSGDTLVLGLRYPRRTNEVGQIELVVASGPDVGRRLAIRPGRFTVGRDAGCDLTLTDPQVSRRHLQLDVDMEDQVRLTVLAADRNEVRSEGRTLTGEEVIGRDQVLRLGASTLVLRRRPARQMSRVDAFGQVPFHRTPYFPAPVQEVTIDAVDDVPSEPEKTRFAYLSAILPLLMGLTMFLVFDRLRMLLFVAFSPLMVIGNYFEQRRRTGKKFTESVRRFDEAVEAKAIEVRQAAASERSRRFVAAPDLADLGDRTVQRAVDLWVRDRNAHDFLALRIGVGDLPTVFEVKRTDRGDPEFRDQIVEALGDTERITDVPVNLGLADLGVIGLVGKATETTALASSLALQAACLHSPEDLVILAAMAPARRAREWLKWAPHVRSSSSPLACPHMVASKEEADELIGELLREAARRLESGSEHARFPWLLVFLDRALEPDGALVSRLLDACPAAGMSVVWSTDTRERVPRQSRAVIDCRSPASGELSVVSFTDPAEPDLEVDLERVRPEVAADTVRALAPLRDASAANAATAIPRVVPLFTAMGIESVDPDWVAAQWKTDRGYSLIGPIGHTDSGPMVLDLVQHGPHGLIGGTSGAGKSELVMSMVAGLIAYNPPTRVNFLFIDYKGGASSDLFKDVPHTVGYVTNLDGLLSMRALTSLRAELDRRMNLLQGKAKDLAELIERHPDEAPPSLVIVVDEFATLVKEIPDFVAGIVDIAQRGRSLGIHLMLATQRPSGSVNDNIKANTNLRISLRMLDTGESNAVIGAPDAAMIPAPLKGRGYARLGAGDLVAFQSAWAGAPLLADQGTPPVQVAPFAPTPMPATAGFHAARIVARDGAGPPVDEAAGPDRRPVGAEPERSQVDALLDAVVETTHRLGHGRGRPPWLEVLPTTISIESLFERHRAEGSVLEPGRRILFGMVDDPAAQAQYPAVVDMARSGGLMIHGTGGSGKSTLLETMAVSSALADDAAGGGRLTIFALDFASRELGSLHRLPQCGGVASGDDLEAVTRIIALLGDEFERRRQALADAVAAAEAPPEETAVLLLVDGIEAVTELMEQAPSGSGLYRYATLLWSLLTDGRQVGIHAAIASSRRSGFKANVASAISGRIVLRQAEAHGYTEAGLSSADAKGIELEPGQGFFDGSNLIQVARLVMPGEAEDAAAGAIDEQERRRREREHLVGLASTLRGAVDPRLRTAALPREVGLLPSPDPVRPVIGLADLTGRPFTLDLTFNDVSLVGDPRTGRSTALAAIATQVATAGGDVWLLGPPGSALERATGATMRCFGDVDDRNAYLEELVAMAEAGPIDGAPPRLFLLDDYDLLPENDRDLAGVLGRIMSRVRWVAAGTKPRGYSSAPLAQEVRKARSVIFLKPTDAREGQEVLDTPIDWHPGLPMVAGRGLVGVDRVATMVQISNPFPESR